MGVDVTGQFLGRQVPLLREREFGQHLGDVVAHEVCAEKLVGVGVGEELDEARGLAHAARLAVRAERERGGLDVETGVLGLLLGQSERGDLRLAERRARHEPVVAERHGLGARDGLRCDDALRLGDVCELELRGDVADRVDAVDVGAHEVVDCDGAAFGELDAGVLESEALDAGSEADRHEHAVDGDLSVVALGVLVGNGDVVAVVGDGLDSGGGQDLHAELLVLLGDLLGDVDVFVGEHAVEELDDRHVDAVVGEHVAELHADRARADDDDGAGQIAGEDLGLVGDDVVGELDARQEFDHRAGVDDDVVEGDLAVADLDGLGIDEGAVPLDLGDLVLLVQVVHALGARVGDATTAVECRAVVEGHIPGYPERLRLMVEDVGELGVAQQRLGRNTSNVQTDTAPILLFDDGGVHAQLGGPDRGHVPTWTCSQDNCFKVISHDCQPTTRANLRAERPPDWSESTVTANRPPRRSITD